MKKDFGKALKYIPAILDAWLPWKIQYDEVPGMSVGVVHKGKLVYASGFGFADPLKHQRATAQTCYRIASISKIFTAVCIFQLAEMGRLRLDDPIAKHLLWFKAKNKFTDGSRVTIRQVLSHTGGFFRDGTDPHWSSGRFPTAQELRREQSKDTFSHENLTAFKYSNYGYALLGEVIATASEKSFDRYLRERVLAPLRINHTTADLDLGADLPLAHGYGMKFPGVEPKRSRLTKTNAYAAAAGLISNVPDLAKFMSALSSRTERSIISRESFKEMTREQWKVEDTDTCATAYGIGIMIGEITKRKILVHSGGFMGYVSNITWDPDEELGAIVLVNSNDGEPSGTARGIMKMIYHLADHAGGFSPWRNLQKYAGTYRSRWGDEVVVPVGRVLACFNPSLSSPSQNWMVLRPQGKDTFIMEGKNMFDHVGEAARFEFKKGKAVRLYWGPMPHKRIL